jgi:nicotinamide-nucleotide amidase
MVTPGLADITAQAQLLGAMLQARGHTVALAESCTGGMVGAALTAVPGASAWFGFGWICYANAAKETLLGVPATLLAEQGAVSAACVEALAAGALQRSGADWALALSGIAGPEGGTPDKPVGTVWLAVAGREGYRRQWRVQLPGERQAVRVAAVQAGLQGLLDALRDHAGH